MKVQVELMASLRRPKNLSRISIQEVKPFTSIRRLLSELKYKETELSLLQVFCNSEKVNLNHEIDQNCKKIFVTIPIGGG